MRLQGGSAGYTVLEVMIFMAVSMLLFVSAMVAIGGRQAQVQFAQGTRDLESKIQDIINDVSTGFFPTTNEITCTVIGAGGGNVSFNSSDSNQGTNEDCVFLGKVLQLEGGDTDKLNVFTVAGRRAASGLSDSDPTVAQHASTLLKVISQLQNGIRIYNVVRPTSGLQFGSVAFVARQGSLSSGAGISTTDFVPVSGTTISTNENSTINLINANLATSSQNPSDGLIICLRDGPNGSRRAAITIGSNGGRTTTRLDFDTRNRTACP